MRRLGVFGGTFDPPHVGHLVVAQDVHEALGLERLLFVPAGLPPHKPRNRVTPGRLRLEMLRGAVGNDPRFDVSPLELERPGPSYTVDTLRELRARHPDAELHLVVGSDLLREFDTWREPREIARLARLAVLARGGEAPEAVRCPVDVPFRVLQVTGIDLSSTEVRRRVREGRSIRYLVPEPVRAVIEREGLYRGEDGP